jgi:HlyD family secretion protein
MGSMLLVIGLVVVMSGCTSTQNIHAYTGNVEGLSVELAFENTGKIKELSGQEGQAVKKGDKLGQLDVSALILKRKTLDLQIQKFDNQRSLLINRISDQEALALNEDETSVQSQLFSLKKDLKDQQSKTAEFKTLFETGAISSNQYDEATQRERKLEDQIQSASAALSALKIRIADKLLGPKAEELKAIDLDLALLDIQQQEIELSIQKSELTAPVDGTIEVKYAEAGEFIAVGVPIYKIIQMQQLTLTLYVPETVLSKIELGQRVYFLDKSVDKSSFGEIGFIASVAEFTPKNTESTDSKHELVYRVKLNIVDPAGRIKPGMFLTAVLGDDHE